MKTIKFILLALIVSSILINKVSSQNVGDPAPDFSFPSIDGDTIKLSDYEGKVLFIFVLGNGCQYCLAVGNKTETQIFQAYKNNENFAAIGLDVLPRSFAARDRVGGYALFARAQTIGVGLRDDPIAHDERGPVRDGALLPERLARGRVVGDVRIDRHHVIAELHPLGGGFRNVLSAPQLGPVGQVQGDQVSRQSLEDSSPACLVVRHL